MGSGGTIIPLSSPSRNHCGTDTTGWLNGRLPKKIGIIVNESICFASGSDECLISLQASVLCCIGNFYIYFLSPVSICNPRYCTT
ncbi:unnamed protein product [Rotaria magnacalcarata]|nr:unnamed protein product [Rotaria magnacalcarata]